MTAVAVAVVQLTLALTSSAEDINDDDSLHLLRACKVIK
jgi:hypothetical protein